MSKTITSLNKNPAQLSCPWFLVRFRVLIHKIQKHQETIDYFKNFYFTDGSSKCSQTEISAKKSDFENLWIEDKLYTSDKACRNYDEEDYEKKKLSGSKSKPLENGELCTWFDKWGIAIRAMVELLRRVIFMLGKN